MVQKLCRYLKDPIKLFLAIAGRGWCPLLSDKVYLKLKYKKEMGVPLDLENPRTFNEKLQWLKLYDRNPEYCKMVDKYTVKDYVANRIGKSFIIPTIGVWDTFDDIDFDSLPQQFVLKCTHDSGGLVICKDKSRLDMAAAKEKINKCMKRNFFYYGREWPYKNVKPQIIAEEYMVDESGVELKDYKFYAFDGMVKMIQVDFGRFTNHRRNLYTPDWTIIKESIQYPCDFSQKLERPAQLEEMLDLASSLSKGFPHVRVDFYIANERVYFGEMTFYSECGFGRFSTREFELKVGGWIKLPNKAF